MVPTGVASERVRQWIDLVERRGAGATAADLHALFAPLLRDTWAILDDPDRFRAAAPTMRFATSTVDAIEEVADDEGRSVVVRLRRADVRLECHIAFEDTPPHRIVRVRDTLEGGVSLSAVNVAISRELHRRCSAVPVFDDVLAERIGGAFVREAVERTLRTGTRGTPPVMPLARFRLAEAELESARAEGCHQYVLLGAGLDSWAYRHERTSGLTVFEVDAPATQAFKRRRLGEAGIAEPPFVRYVPVDFEVGSLPLGLAAAGFDAAERSVLAWLGVVAYLTPAAIDETLDFVGALAPGTRLIFDYFRPPETWDAGMRNGSVLAAGNGEPWRTTFADDDLDALLARHGLHVVDRLTAADALLRYPTDDTALAANGATVAVVAEVS